MDNTVALVSAYLQVNGYFCVTEYPLLERSRSGDNTRSVISTCWHSAFPMQAWK